MSKLGIVTIEDFDGALRWAIANKPTAVEFMLTKPLDASTFLLIKDLAQSSPQTLLVVRAYPDDYNHPDFQDRMLSWAEPLRDISNRVVAHSVNEVVPFNAEEAKRLNEYEIGFIQRMSAVGLIPMCFCLSESHLGGPTLDQQGNVVNWGNLPLWQHMASGVKALAEAKGFLGFNEYDWPSWNSSRDRGYKWRLGHLELNLQHIKKYINGPLPTVGIGEGVLDGKIWTSRLPKDHPLHNKPYGYKKIKSGSDYLVDIDRIHKECYNTSQVAFNLLFAWAPGHPHWNSYDVSVMDGILANYLKANPPEYWEPGEQPVSDDLIHAIDVSEWGGLIKDEQWKAAYDAGYRLAVVQAWGGGPVPGGKNRYCVQQLAGARKAGMITATYFCLPPDTTTQTHSLVQAAKDAAGDEYQYIKFVAIDVEGDRLVHPTNPEARLANTISSVIEDRPAVIYSSRYMWEVCMNDATGFEQYPLWDARYDEIANLDANWAPYGGWTQRAMKQYAGTSTVAGNILVDLNIASIKRLLGAIPIPESEPEDDIETLKQEIKQLEAEGETKDATIQKQVDIMTTARNTLNTALNS